jgi:site-specific recombinase XerD
MRCAAVTSLAPIREAFFTDRLLTQRRASPHTVAAYRDTFTLLLGYALARTGKHPAQLELGDLDAALIAAFLQHLETDRGNSVSTRNARLAAIHSLFRYAALRAPEHAALIARVLAVPSKRQHRPLVCFLDREQIEALLAAPDQTHWTGRRDHAVLLVLTQTGLRVSELTGLAVQDVQLGTGAHVFCRGKGRKERATPLTSQTVEVLRSWLAERRGHGHDPLFPTRRGGPLSRDAVERLVAKHTATATNHRPSLQTKTVTPHVLRHSAAMALLHAGVDITVIALWTVFQFPNDGGTSRHGTPQRARQNIPFNTVR